MQNGWPVKTESNRQILRFGVSLKITEIEYHGPSFPKGHINPPPENNGARAAVGKHLIQWIFRMAVVLIAAPIAAAAIIKWLGLR
jgi:hypothetical protein